MTDNEIDILSIDDKIQLKFKNETKKLPEYKERLKELEKSLYSGNLSSRNVFEIEKNISELKNIIEKLDNNEEHNFYIIETAEILEKYKQILKTPVKLSFCGKKTNNDKTKINIIHKYLEIAQKYYKIDSKTEEKKFKISCHFCDNTTDFVVEENAYICLNCYSQQELLQHTISYKDSDRVNISSKYTYDRKVHFRDCINQYQGKQNCSIDKEVYDKLEDIFERHHLLVGDKNTKRETRFSKITKEHILMFLRELGFPKHYENVTLIHYNITGKKPDDISYLEEKLLNDFDILVETYDKHFKNKVERVNFISTQYVLYQLLQKHKHDCRKEDFIILKTMDRKTFHDSICKELFSILGWNFTPLY
jgi:hypothetical protein